MRISQRAKHGLTIVVLCEASAELRSAVEPLASRSKLRQKQRKVFADVTIMSSLDGVE